MITPEERDVLSKLKFISKLQSGFKMNTKNLTIQPDTWYTALLRTFLTLDDRDKSYTFVSTVISKSFEILIQYIGKIEQTKIRSEHSSGDQFVRRTNGDPLKEDHEDSIFYNIICANIIEDLKNSLMGINHLKETYKTDKLLCCQYEVLTGEINARLTEFKKIHSTCKFLHQPKAPDDNYLNF